MEDQSTEFKRISSKSAGARDHHRSSIRIPIKTPTTVKITQW